MMKKMKKAFSGKSADSSRTSENSQTRKRPRMRCSEEELILCCKNSNGIMSSVSAALSVDWHTAAKYIRNCPEAQEAFRSARESVKDFAESKLLQIIKNPDHPRHFDAITFLLKTLGKDRGFTERIEQEVSGIKEPPSLNIVIEK